MCHKTEECLFYDLHVNVYLHYIALYKLILEHNVALLYMFLYNHNTHIMLTMSQQF